MNKTPIEKIHFHLHMYIFLAGADREEEMVKHFNEAMKIVVKEYEKVKPDNQNKIPLVPSYL